MYIYTQIYTDMNTIVIVKVIKAFMKDVRTALKR